MPEITSLADGQENVVWNARIPDGGQASRLPLHVKAGTYLAGKLIDPAAGATLDLIDAEGRHLRRLASEKTGQLAFYLLVPEGAAYLAAMGPSSGLAIEISRNLVPDQPRQESNSSSFLSPRMAALSQTLAEGGSTTTFWEEAARSGTPLVEQGKDGEPVITFLYRGAADGVRILGAPSSDHDPMMRLGQSDVWYRSYSVPPDTRLSYRLAPDVPAVPGSFWERRVAILATAQEDPLNRHPWPEDGIDVYARKSKLELPEAPAQPYVAERQDVAKGTLEEFTFTSLTLENSRKITLYRPADFDPADPLTLLLVTFDGKAYQTDIPVPVILDNMQADRALPQTAAILISNPDMETRSRELPGNPEFARVVAQEILPEALSRLGLTASPERTVLAGSSFGGIASTRTALAYPEVFGNVISLSGSYWWSPAGTPVTDQEYTARQVADAPRAPVRVFLTAGLFESGQKSSPDILSTNRHLRTVMKAKGYDVRLREYAASHDYLYWRGALSDGLEALFPDHGTHD
ncbi:alpha/beta hydrolase-fold protein [Roseibium litorale]|uniref:DUF3327 domain-containing protein n=1 Tax=Roseibium litorale TaxID=2803841 RepID=A0ABR9CU00_9HYPH|nr:alpha/beta hydrolase-fold protein [Roseibium litorale]MBD8893890.1 DUF3327 domain-containing protein [Roseibium litorale]